MAKRQEVADFAVQFVGNPYVWGGTSLTNGADCSGFVMSVFASFGYALPRVAAAQYGASVKKRSEPYGSRGSCFLRKRNFSCGFIYRKWQSCSCTEFQ